MTPVARRYVWSVAVGVVVVAGCVAVLIRFRPHAPNGVPLDLIPASWAQYRETPGHQLHVGTGKVECRECHDFERSGFKNPGVAVCQKCHAREKSVAHHGSPSTSTDCLTCHAFALGRTEPKCIDCHAKAEGNIPGVVQHATVDCATCHHLRDAPSIVPAACSDCHEERASAHARHAGSNNCLDCHHAHEPASAAKVVCASCHAQAAQPHPPAHDACLNCHEPHGFAASDSTCIGCHGPKTTLVDREVPAHRVCTNCHAPHAPGHASGACLRCHQEVQPRHGNAQACVTCHLPHGDDPVAVAATCTSCHAKVAPSDRDAHAGGVACEGCHKPHAFAGLDQKTLCRNCHERQTALVASNPGHGDCRSCHGVSVVHTVAPPAPCSTCHAAERKTAPAGHQRCVGCHEPHAGKPTPACATCHANMTGKLHASIQGGCETCHRPHGPSGVATPPACTTCHAPATLPALHLAPGHAACASCHASPHEPPAVDRAACTGSCHADRRNHQPSAGVCTGCHVFRR
jgi:hypothetical protein